MANFEITSPITNFRYLGESNAATTNETAKVESLSETTERTEILDGRTYKLRSPIYEAALYITINDIILNEGTMFETRRPFEIFINSKAMESFQWIVALTRMISAVFRKGGDVIFIVEELKSVNDPKGGYWKKGRYITSIVAEIAEVIEQHFINLGLMASVESVPKLVKKVATPMEVCPKCQAPALIKASGCSTCGSCGWSRCG